MGNALAVWFTADTHFGHSGALSLYRRPFASVDAMNAGLIAQWCGRGMNGRSHGGLEPLPRLVEGAGELLGFQPDRGG